MRMAMASFWISYLSCILHMVDILLRWCGCKVHAIVGVPNPNITIFEHLYLSGVWLCMDTKSMRLEEIGLHAQYCNWRGVGNLYDHYIEWAHESPLKRKRKNTRYSLKAPKPRRKLAMAASIWHASCTNWVFHILGEVGYTLTSILSHPPFYHKVWHKQGVTYLIMSHLEDLCIMWYYQRNR